MENFTDYIQKSYEIQKARTASYMELLPEDGKFTEDDLWEAIADANGMDVSEIMDGDLAEWL